MTALTRLGKEPLLAEDGIPRTSGRYTVTPEIALAWLGYVDNPRPIDQPTLAVYARDMRNGHWIENDESIKWSDEEPIPKMIDGEHRLRACVLAGVPFTTRVAVGVPREAARTFDLGRRRSLGSILAINMGERYANHLASCATILWRWRQSPATVIDTRLRPSLHDVIDTIEANPGLRTSVELIHGSFAKSARLARSATVPVLIHHEGTLSQGPDKATAFIEQIHRGSGIRPGDPAYALREKLIKLKGERNVRFSQHEMLAYWIPAWNAFAFGKEMRRLHPLDWSEPDDIEIL